MPPLSIWITQALNALSTGTLLILIVAGLSFVAGMMKVINIAHAAFYMLGAYIGFSVLHWTQNFWVAALLAPLGVGVLGLLIEVSAIRPLYRRDPLYTLLLTLGLTLVLIQLVRVFWGSQIHSIATPAFAQGMANLAGILYPKYRLFILLFSGVVTLAVWLFLARTEMGLVVRAGTYDPEMVNALGTNISRVFTLVFAFGAALAALAGVLVGPLTSAYPEMGIEIIIDAFVVLVIGGMGSFKGAVIGSLVVGLAASFGAAIWPGLARGAIFLLMALVLLVRPTGLFGEAEL
ncbi:MAG: branched-chain amino acid ABC transporter permease [Deltaproteobacteria bacterium]|nr:branched-chain amino acid ABC transporter permease [Deltaproteobacteria bacterium]